uniref:ADP-ribosylation factor-like protein 6 n=1 Tax=Panagrolaimus superbus TaxID=310955 RepID=A0A914Z8T3_9BILA
MGSASSSLFQSTEHPIVLLGLDHAGKTTVLYRLKKQKMVLPTPTVGFNCETIKVNHGPARGHTFVMWDVGGQENYRLLWPHYVKTSTALIFILDASDQQKFEEAKVELDTVLQSVPNPDKFPLILLANKQDKPEAASLETIINTFTNDLQENYIIKILLCTAVTGEGLEKFFPEVLSAIQQSKRANR